MDDLPMRFEMWLGQYLGATATASLGNGPGEHLVPFADQDSDDVLVYRLTGPDIDGFLDALCDGPLDQERRSVWGLPVLARAWVERHHGHEAAAAEPTLIAVPITGTDAPPSDRPSNPTRTVVISGDTDAVPVVFEMRGPTVVIGPGESLRLTMSGPADAELTVGLGTNGISLFRDEQLIVEAYGPRGDLVDTDGFA